MDVGHAGLVTHDWTTQLPPNMANSWYALQNLKSDKHKKAISFSQIQSCFSTLRMMQYLDKNLSGDVLTFR